MVENHKAWRMAGCVCVCEQGARGLAKLSPIKLQLPSAMQIRRQTVSKAPPTHQAVHLLLISHIETLQQLCVCASFLKFLIFLLPLFFFLS